MQDFPVVPASKKSLSFRKPVCGVGINDADYVVKPLINGAQLICPYYCKWHNMLVRCYSSSFHKKNPTYKDCAVASEWLLFSNFRKWMIRQDWQDKHLDKDILHEGNKAYSAETCVFISCQLNTLLIDCGASRGKYPIGVTWHKRDCIFRAQINIDGKTTHIGLYPTMELASAAYDKVRSAKIKEIALEQSDQRIKNALLSRAGISL